MAERIPCVYGYARVSSARQVNEGDSLQDQDNRIRRYFDFHFAEQKVTWGGVFQEKQAQSAFKIPFMRRKAGKLLMQKLQRGDHLIVDKLDRLWRKMEDFVTLLKVFKQMGVTLHFVSLSGASVQLGTTMGDFFIQMMVAIAEVESKRIRERVLASFAERVGPGRPHIKLLTGCRWKQGRKRKDRYLEWSPIKRQAMGQILKLRDELELTWREIGEYMKLNYPHAFPKYGEHNVRQMYYAEKFYRDRGFKDPAEIMPDDLGPDSLYWWRNHQKPRKNRMAEAALDGSAMSGL